MDVGSKGHRRVPVSHFCHPSLLVVDQLILGVGSPSSQQGLV